MWRQTTNTNILGIHFHTSSILKKIRLYSINKRSNYPETFSVGTWVVGGGPDEGVGRGVHGLQLHRLTDCVVGTNPQHLVPSHQDTIEVFGRVEEDLYVADAALLPLAEVTVPSVELGSLLKQDFLIFLARLRLHLKKSESCSETRPLKFSTLNKIWKIFWNTSGREIMGSK